jgi:hypothetical protein
MNEANTYFIFYGLGFGYLFRPKKKNQAKKRREEGNFFHQWFGRWGIKKSSRNICI